MFEKRYVEAPVPNVPWWETTTEDIKGIWLAENEEVEWNVEGDKVIGYKITIKPYIYKNGEYKVKEK